MDRDVTAVAQEFQDRHEVFCGARVERHAMARTGTHAPAGPFAARTLGLFTLAHGDAPDTARMATPKHLRRTVVRLGALAAYLDDAVTAGLARSADRDLRAVGEAAARRLPEREQTGRATGPAWLWNAMMATAAPEVLLSDPSDVVAFALDLQAREGLGITRRALAVAEAALALRG